MPRPHLQPATFSMFYTNIIDRKCPSLFDPCLNVFHVEEIYSTTRVINLQTLTGETPSCDIVCMGRSVLTQIKDNDEMGLSLQDAFFIRTMEERLKKDGEMVG